MPSRRPSIGFLFIWGIFQGLTYAYLRHPVMQLLNVGFFEAVGVIFFINLMIGWIAFSLMGILKK